MAEIEVDLEIQRGEASQLCLQGPTAGMNEIQTVALLSITSQCPGRVPPNYPSSVNCSCFGGQKARWFTASPGLHTVREKRGPPRKVGIPLFLGKENRTKTTNVYYRSKRFEDKWFNLSAQTNRAPSLRRPHWGKGVGPGPNLVFSQIWFSN